ncbi:MAG: hypothetical protein FJZ01_19695 [Candidatus Sericytochromatia bacterium]|nr:hypothetical protein [Candidatus Tanganyikabacteria bacterium]
MPLVEVGPGYVSPTTGGYSAPGAAAPAPAAPAPAAPALPALPRDNFNGLPAPSAPVLAPAPTAPAGAPVQAKSFFSNLWDQFIGPLVKGVWNFISGLFGGRSA